MVYFTAERITRWPRTRPFCHVLLAVRQENRADIENRAWRQRLKRRWWNTAVVLYHVPTQEHKFLTRLFRHPAWSRSQTGSIESKRSGISATPPTTNPQRHPRTRTPADWWQFAPPDPDVDAISRRRRCVSRTAFNSTGSSHCSPDSTEDSGKGWIPVSKAGWSCWSAFNYTLLTFSESNTDQE